MTTQEIIIIIAIVAFLFGKLIYDKIINKIRKNHLNK